LAWTGDGEKYSVTLDTDTFDRAGEDGDIPVLPLNGGDEFVGEALEGQWHKGWDADITTPTATISGGVLRMTGVATVLGVTGNVWVNSFHVIPLLDKLEITVSMEVPVDDTGATANRDITFDFTLKQDKDEGAPSMSNNYVRFRTEVDENGLILRIQKNINGGGAVTLASGFDYTMDTTRSTGNLEATIWRLVFNGKPGTPSATMSVYLKQADTLANAESATEHEVTGSPFDISDLAFVIGYPCYEIRTQHATYFGATYDSANRAASTYLRVNYDNSPFKIHYDFTPADYGEGDVELWDGDPDSGGVRVYDEDHEFANDPYLQNGLIRIQIDEGAQTGVRLYWWSGAAWVLATLTTGVPRHFFHLQTDDKQLSYSYLVSIEYLSPEKINLKIKWVDTATNNDDYYVISVISLTRGKYDFTNTPLLASPIQEISYLHYLAPSSRFGYAGNNAIGDDDLNIHGANTTLTDDFTILFDDDGAAVLMGISPNKKPDGATTRFYVYDGRAVTIEQFKNTTFLDTVFTVYLSPFSNVSNLFEEAEDATLGGGATAVADAGASGGQAALLDAQTEYVRYDFTAGTDLPSGRYLAVVRVRDTNQVADDVELKITNFTDAEQRGERGEPVNFQAAAAYAYYSEFFDITDADATGTDAMRITVTKDQAAANDIYVDYILIIPIGDGYNLPQDLAHSSLRGVTQLPRLCER